jgi:ribosomal protein L21E
MQRMTRFLPVLLVLSAVAFAAAPALFAQSVEQQPLAQGIVSSVDAARNRVSIAGGQIVIDVTGAEIKNDSGPVPFTAIRPGAHIATVIIPGTYGPGVPLKARVVQILTQPLGSLTGTVEAIDLTAGTFTVLGHRIRVNEHTRMGGEIPSRDPRTLAELEVGQSVHVELNGSLDELVAARVFVHSPPPDRRFIFTGVVLSIQQNVWTIQSGEHVVTVYTTSQTSIHRLAVVGSTVQVLARGDRDQITAISIDLYAPPRVNPPRITQTIVGILTGRTAESITVNNGPSTTQIFLASYTRFIDDPQIGDNVRVTVMRDGDRLTATSVEKFNGPITIVVIDRVLEINGNMWRVGTYEVALNDSTTVEGAPAVGDRVRVVGERQASGVILARVISKL